MKVELNEEQMEYLKSALKLAFSSTTTMMATGHLNVLPPEGMAGAQYSLEQWAALKTYLESQTPVEK